MIENNELKSVRLYQTISVKDLISVDLPGTKNSLSLANKCSKCNKDVYRLECFHFHCSFELPADDHRKDLLCKTHL